ncbi:MAG: hypothetical protein EB120_07875 [Proteobacteria bacterium]|nr:hypothetical protein [Pseudomonadota bacterium]NDG27076.1 hypothetical protein [Pseudomonadota bacterium]
MFKGKFTVFSPKESNSHSLEKHKKQACQLPTTCNIFDAYIYTIYMLHLRVGLAVFWGCDK